MPSRACKSVWHMPVATIRSSTSSAQGGARSSVCNSKGAARAGTTAAVIFMDVIAGYRVVIKVMWRPDRRQVKTKGHVGRPVAGNSDAPDDDPFVRYARELPAVDAAATALRGVPKRGDEQMAYDLLIKGGTVVDGTGAPGCQADIAVKDGRIAEIGRVGASAAKTLDVAGLIVAPGFIDPHTHYDAQICWDPAISPSSWHGVTSVVMGNCGVGIAPCKAEAREIAMRDLVNVEGIPFDVLNEGITWDAGGPGNPCAGSARWSKSRTLRHRRPRATVP
jgi:hypothetical protein